MKNIAEYFCLVVMGATHAFRNTLSMALRSWGELTSRGLGSNGWLPEAFWRGVKSPEQRAK